MENVGISGFDNEKPNEDPREITVRLADLGASMGSCRIFFLPLVLTSNSQQARKPRDFGTDIPKSRGAFREAMGRKHRRLVMGHRCK
jgi:hypothetical protein